MSTRIAALFLMFTLPAFTWSQSITGSMRGIVTDENNEPVAGATITISSEALIGQTRITSTTASGAFRFPSLPLGFYSVEVEVQRFDRIRAEGVEVTLASTAYVPLTMKLAAAEAITIVGDAPLIDPDKPGLSTIYREEMLENLPSRRNMWFLMQVAPGVTIDHTAEGGSAVIAFGSNRQSNAWHIDGIDVTGPETGMAWWNTNPDIIEQIQVYGVGAPAEYGNHTGAVLNVVTKQGSNSFHGAFNSFLQTDALTGTNVRLDDSDFGFHREKYYDITGQAGGPLVRDKVWFFSGVEALRDAFTTAGNDPNYAPTVKSDKYDLKVSSRIGTNHELATFGHYEKYDFPETPNPYITTSALHHEFGTNPAWGAILTSTLSDELLLETRYAGWWADDFYASQTGSLEDPFFDTKVFPATISGGSFNVWDYTTYRHQVNAKATYFAEHFLHSRHEFKFGVQYARGSADTILGLGPNGLYLYDWDFYGYITYYHISQTPYHYGGVSNSLGLFLDDTIAANDRLTLNLGIRFDRNLGSIPSFDQLEIGRPSISRVGNFRPTGERKPDVENFVDWKLISPRLGFVWQTRDDGRAVLRGSFGVYYDHDTMGNWDAPPPDVESFRFFHRDPITGELFFIGEGFRQDEQLRQNRLKPPRALQYSIGYEYQPTDNSSLGVQYVYKDTKDLIGWEITGGTYQPFLFTDPITGRQYTLYHIIEPALIQKGNDPGDFPGSEGLRYFQKYNGLIITFSKRFADDWALNASYTWSKSYGLLPRMHAQNQYAPFYRSREGAHPNSFVNAEGRLQGDRPYMFRAQIVFLKLPWDLQTAASVEFSSGRPYARLATAFERRHPPYDVIMEPFGSYRYSPVQNMDLAIGKRIAIGQLQLRIDGEILNLLNSDQELRIADLHLEEPGQTFIPISWVAPRRLQVRLGLQF